MRYVSKLHIEPHFGYGAIIGRVITIQDRRDVRLPGEGGIFVEWIVLPHLLLGAKAGLGALRRLPGWGLAAVGTGPWLGLAKFLQMLRGPRP